MGFKKIKDKIFKNTVELNAGGGLFVTVDELIEQRRYAYQWQQFNDSKFSTYNAGDVKSVFKGRGMEFEEIRAYAFGDDVRDIDWRVTARKQLPYTKLYTEEKDREVYVLLDLSPQMLFGTKKELKSVVAAKVTARIAWQSLKNKDRFGCVISDGRENLLIKAQNSQSNMMMAFKKIADISRKILNFNAEKVNENGLLKAIKLLQQAIKHRAIVFVVSDFSDFSDETKKALATLSKKAQVSCVNVYDVLEKSPPVAGEYMVQQDNQQLVFSSYARSYRQEYRSYFAKKHQQIRDFCIKFNMNYIETCSIGIC